MVMEHTSHISVMLSILLVFVTLALVECNPSIEITDGCFDTEGKKKREGNTWQAPCGECVCRDGKSICPRPFCEPAPNENCVAKDDPDLCCPSYICPQEHAVPSSPVQYIARATSPTSILVQWKPPVNSQTSIVRGYKLSYGVGFPNQEIVELDTSALSYVISSLQPDASYVIRLRAFNRWGDGISAYASVQTDGLEPSSSSPPRKTNEPSSSVEQPADIQPGQCPAAHRFRRYLGVLIPGRCHDDSGCTATNKCCRTGFGWLKICMNVVQVEEPTVLNPPTRVQSSPVSSTSIRLTWEDNYECCDQRSYQIRFRIAVGEPDGRWQYGGYIPAMTYDFTGLQPGKMYEFAVQVIRSDGKQSLFSEGTIARTSFSDLLPPTNLRGTVTSPSSVRLEWEDDYESYDPRSYEIRYRSREPANAEWEYNTTLSLSFEVTRLQPNTTYDFAVRAIRDLTERSEYTLPFTTQTSASVFIEKPVNSYVVRHTMPVTLTCRTDVPPKSMSYECNSQIMDVSRVDYREEVGSTTASIDILRRDVEEHTGEEKFWCQCLVLTDDQQIHRSEKAFVAISFIRKQFEEQPQDVVAQLGDPMQLTCRPPTGVPTPIVSWQKDGQIIDISPNNVDKVVTANGDLMFFSAKAEDAGQYQCVATNNANMRSSITVTVTIV